MDVQATLDQFVNTNLGKSLDFDHQYGAQCVDLINFWAQALGKRPFSGVNAIGVPGLNHDQWTWVPNTPAGVPPAGAIVCFAANANYNDIKTGPAGHVDLARGGGNTNTFPGFDQNWNDVQKCEEVSHSYDAVLGWLVPIEAAPAPSGGMAEAIRVTNVRMAPSTAAQITSVLQAGNTFSFQNIVDGQEVTQNGVTTNKWYHSTLGHFVWAGNVKTL